MSEAEVLKDGVHVPRTLVTDKLEDVPIRVLNVSGEPVHLKAGYPLAELHPVSEVIGAVPVEKEQVSYEAVIKEMVSGVDPSVDQEVKSELAQLLGEFASVISREWQRRN